MKCLTQSFLCPDSTAECQNHHEIDHMCALKNNSKQKVHMNTLTEKFLMWWQVYNTK